MPEEVKKMNLEKGILGKLKEAADDKERADCYPFYIVQIRYTCLSGGITNVATSLPPSTRYTKEGKTRSNFYCQCLHRGLKLNFWCSGSKRAREDVR